MKLIHYTVSPFKMKRMNYRREYNKYRKNTSEKSWNPKPFGLWISIESDHFGENECYWMEWATESLYLEDPIKYKYELILKSSANILEISNLQDLFDFTERYGQKRYSSSDDMTLNIEIFQERYPNLKETDLYSRRPHCSYIEWSEVMKKWQGIFIYPYHYQVRHHDYFTWYNVWDVSSGCLWDLKAIDTIKEYKNV